MPIIDPFAEDGTDPEIAKAEAESPQSVLSDKPEFAPAEDSTTVDPRIAELEQRLAEAEAKAAAAESAAKRERPKPESQLTPEEKKIRDLEDRLARAEAAKFEDEPETLIAPNPGSDTILLHFLEDGYTALGRVWYRGQELEFEVGSQAYQDTKDRKGRSWLELLDDEPTQFEKFGKVMFRRGPWPGKKYEEDAALTEERKRNRAAPVLPRR